MTAFPYESVAYFTQVGSSQTYEYQSETDASGSVEDIGFEDPFVPDQFQAGEELFRPGEVMGTGRYVGYMRDSHGNLLFVAEDYDGSGIVSVFALFPSADIDFAGLSPINLDTDLNTDPLYPSMYCFAEGTLIETPTGPRKVETLAIGDPLLTAEGKTVPVKWLGQQTIRKFLNGNRIQPVRIRAGALGDGLPRRDLTVTGEHGIVIDGLVINAAALVNNSTIDWVPLDEIGDSVTYYHVETEEHDVILAEGAPAETFIDYLDRRSFDNYQEYVDRYGAERIIREMDAPRISAARLVPDAIKARLGISQGDSDAVQQMQMAKRAG